MNRKTIAQSISTALLLAAIAFGPLGGTIAEAATPSTVVVFSNGTDGYPIYRIPSLLCTPKGTLLAFCEARRGNDQSPTDMVLRRSLDGGKTWLPMQVIVKAVPEAAMDPTVIFDRITQETILVYDRWPVTPEGHEAGDSTPHRKPGVGRDSITTWIMTSRDDGATWSAPRDITATTKRPGWMETIHGPGVGIQTRSGRLVIPCAKNEGEPWSNYAIYSDDHGKTWQLSDNETDLGVNETQVVELADGTLLLNMRSDDAKRGCRVGATSGDGGKTWSKLSDIRGLPDTCCQASLLRYSWADALQQDPIPASFAGVAHRRQRSGIKALATCCVRSPYR